MKLDLKELYKDLPENSRCREARNPWSFNSFLRTESYRDWPYTGLFVDSAGELRWLHFCNSVILAQFETGDIDEIISKSTKESLRCIEVYCRTGKHYFLKQHEKVLQYHIRDIGAISNLMQQLF